MDPASSDGPLERPVRTRTAESPRRIVLYLMAGAIVIYGSTYTGAVAFYYRFQSPLEARRDLDGGGVLWRAPGGVTPSQGAGWGSVRSGGVLLPVPPGEVVGIDVTGESCRLRGAQGELVFDRFPPGFLPSVWNGQLTKLGARPLGTISDAEALPALAQVTPGQYGFDLPQVKRQEYAARMLCKMLLWEDGPVRRFELANRAEPAAAACVLLELESGRVQVIIAGPDGVLVARIEPDAAADWRSSSAGDWLPAE